MPKAHAQKNSSLVFRFDFQESVSDKMAAAKCNAVVVWEWETDVPGIYAPYSAEASNLIEQENNRGSTQVDLSTIDRSHRVWKVNLSLMVQNSAIYGK